MRQDIVTIPSKCGEFMDVVCLLSLIIRYCVYIGQGWPWFGQHKSPLP